MGYEISVDLFVKNKKGKWKTPTVAQLKALVQVSDVALWLFGEISEIDGSAYEGSSRRAKWYELNDELVTWSKALGLQVYADVMGEDGNQSRVYASEAGHVTCVPTITWSDLPDYA